MNEISHGDLPAPKPPDAVHSPEEMALAERLVAVEESRSHAELKSIEASDAEDKRFAEFQTKRIELDDQADQRRINLLRQVMLCVFVFVSVVVAVVLYMSFWGSESQQRVAVAISTNVGIGVAGFGIIYTVLMAIQALLRRL